MFSKFKSGIGFKVPMALALFLMLALIGISISGYSQSTYVAERKVIELEQSQFEILKHEIEGILIEHKSILRSLRDTPPIQAILRAQAGGGVDPNSLDSIAVWQTRLKTIFTAFLNNQHQYLDISYVDINGDELVVVGKNNDKEYVLDYSTVLVEARRLEKGGVYISNVSPEFETDGSINSSLPVFQMATPVYDADGEVRAALVIKLAADYVFSDITSANGAERFLVDQRGNYIKHSDTRKTFAIEGSTDYLFKNDQPLLAELSIDQDQLIFHDHDLQQIVGFQKIYLSEEDKGRYWMIGLIVPESVVFADVAGALDKSLFVSVVISLISLVLIIWVISRQVVDPILRLATAASQLQSGDLKVRVDETSVKDELHTLYSAINSFAEHQQHSTELLEKEIDAQTSRLSAVINNVVDGIITINGKGIIESFNPAAEKIFGYSRDEMIGKNINILMPSPHAKKHDQYLSDYSSTGKKKIIGVGRELEGQRKNGELFPMDLAISEVFIDGERHFIGITRDITERKRVEQLQKEFVSTVSHELRTPLTSISGSLGLILGGVGGELPEKAKSLLTIANNNSERLIHLINDILDMEKISSGKMQFDFKAADLVPIIEQSVEANRGYGDKLNVRFEFHDDIEESFIVRVDEKRMEQVMSNLLSNAAKYSPTNDIVDIRLQAIDDRVRISVHDNGKGIPEEFKSQIFGKFSQADSSDTREKGGTGLGLNITKAIVQSHDGSISFDSEPDQGTTFYVDLPLLAEKKPVHVAVDNTKEDPLILIVEPDKEASKFLSRLMEKGGYRYHLAYSTDEAMQCIEQNQYDAMMLDLLIPNEQSVELLHKLEHYDTTVQLPVVVVSARVDSERSVSGDDSLEMLDWMGEPMDSDDLIDSISARLGEGMPEKAHILHVEDDQDIATVVSSLLGDAYQVTSAASLRQARRCLDERDFDLILLDMALPDGSGIDLLATLQDDERNIPVVIFSAHDTPCGIESQVEATLVKSKTDNKKLKLQIDSAVGRKAS